MKAFSRSKQAISGSALFNFIGLLIALISCIAAVVVVPEIRRLLSLEHEPSVEKVIERVIEKPVYKPSTTQKQNDWETPQSPPVVDEELPRRHFSIKGRRQPTFNERFTVTEEYIRRACEDWQSRECNLVRRQIDMYNQDAKRVIDDIGR
jgi:hypothetical protein